MTSACPKSPKTEFAPTHLPEELVDRFRWRIDAGPRSRPGRSPGCRPSPAHALRRRIPSGVRHRPPEAARGLEHASSACPHRDAPRRPRQRLRRPAAPEGRPGRRGLRRPRRRRPLVGSPAGVRRGRGGRPVCHAGPGADRPPRVAPRQAPAGPDPGRRLRTGRSLAALGRGLGHGRPSGAPGRLPGRGARPQRRASALGRAGRRPWPLGVRHPRGRRRGLGVRAALRRRSEARPAPAPPRGILSDQGGRPRFARQCGKGL